MGIVSRPATKRSRKGHAAVYGPDHGHVNAACCDCPRCGERRLWAYAQGKTRRPCTRCGKVVKALKLKWRDKDRPPWFQCRECYSRMVDECIAEVRRGDEAGQYRIGVDLAKGGDHYTVHSVRVK